MVPKYFTYIGWMTLLIAAIISIMVYENKDFIKDTHREVLADRAEGVVTRKLGEINLNKIKSLEDELFKIRYDHTNRLQALQENNKKLDDLMKVLEDCNKKYTLQKK